MVQYLQIKKKRFKKRESISPACQTRPRLLLWPKWVFCFSAGRERPLTRNVTCPVLKLLYQFQHEGNQLKCIPGKMEAQKSHGDPHKNTFVWI